MAATRPGIKVFGSLAIIGVTAALELLVDHAPAGAAPLAIIERQALDVSAEHLDVDVEKGTALLKGNVTARVGDLEVHCPTIELTYAQSPRVKWARATGG